MENNNKQKEDDALREHISRIVRPIFEKAIKSPSEPTSTQTLVGSQDRKEKQRRAFQPHNIRRYFTFKHINFHPPNQPTTNPPKLDRAWVETTGFSYRPVNYGKEHLFMNWHWCNILVKKHQVSVTYKKLGKQWYNCEYEEPEQYDAFVREKEVEWDEGCKKALALFIEYFGGETDYVILKSNKLDVGFSGDKDIDSLPASLRINTPLYKKEYAEKWEYKGIEPMLNKIYNDSLERKEPKILSSLAEIKAITEENLKSTAMFRESLEVLKKEALEPLTVQLDKHLLVEEKQNVNMDMMNVTLKKQLEVFGEMKKKMVIPKKREKAIGLTALDKAKEKVKEARLKVIRLAYKEAFGHDYW